MQERASDHRPPSPAPDLQPLRFAFAQHLPLHRGGKRWEDAARAVIQTSPPPWLPLTRELSPQATEGENSQQAPSAHPASLQARSISPSVKPFGLATSLVRGRQDEGQTRLGQRVSVAAALALSARKAGFGGECRRHAAGSRCVRRGGQIDRGPRKTGFAGKSSTFHRRKVDRKAAGGPLYQGRNAPRSPPFALSEAARFYTPAPRLPRGFAFPLRGTADEKQFGQRVSVAAALALSARKAGTGGECRRPAAGSRFFRRPRRFNPPGSPQRLRCGAAPARHLGRCRSWRSRWSPRPCG